MTPKTIDDVRAEVNKLASVIGAPLDQLPSYGTSLDFGAPHIEVDMKGYHWVVVERGVEFERETFLDLDGLLYVVFEYVTFSMANDYEVQHRVADDDSRRILFRRQLELLGQLNPGWARRRELDIQEILQRRPYMDNRNGGMRIG